MKSIDVAGVACDETCCRAKAPYSECRCHIAERVQQWRRIQANGQRGELSDAATEAVWREQLRILSVVDEAAFCAEPTTAEVLHRVSNGICGLSQADSVVEQPLNQHHLDIARRMDACAGIVWQSKESED